MTRSLETCRPFNMHFARHSIKAAGQCDDCFVAFSVIVLGSKLCGFACCVRLHGVCVLIFLEGASLSIHFEKHAAPFPMHRNRFSGVSIRSLLLLSLLWLQTSHYWAYSVKSTLSISLSISSIRIRMVNWSGLIVSFTVYFWYVCLGKSSWFGSTQLSPDIACFPDWEGCQSELLLGTSKSGILSSTDIF